jgi:hypothetical protein
MSNIAAAASSTLRVLLHGGPVRQRILGARLEETDAIEITARKHSKNPRFSALVSCEILSPHMQTPFLKTVASLFGSVEQRGWNERAEERV